MYHCNLNCYIISSQLRLETALSQVAVPERFEIALHTELTLTDSILADVDLLVLDTLPELSLVALHEKMKPTARILLCATAEQAALLSDEDLEALEDLWSLPTTDAALRFRYEKLLHNMKVEKDGWLSSTYLDTMIDSIPDLIWFKDVRGSHLKVNNGFCQIVGKTKQQCEGRGHYYIWDLTPEDYAQGEYVCLDTEEEVLRAKKTCLFDEVVKGKEGFRQFQTYKSPIFDVDGTVMGTVGIAHDVTNLKNIDKELAILLQSLPFAVLITDVNGVVTNSNAKLLETFQIEENDILGQDYSSWKARSIRVPSDPLDLEYEDMRQITGTDTFVVVLEEPIVDIFHNCIGYFCICRDVTVERNLQRQIAHNANTDFLTGLYNRRYLSAYVDTLGRDCQLNLLSIDLDNFKHVNDTYGHQVGDETIVASANLIQDHFKDGFVARMGGDEFLVILTGPMSREVLEKRANDLLEAFRDKFAHRAEWAEVSASIGIASGNIGDMPLDDLMLQSDAAMYEVKYSGKSGVQLYDN